jgi:hypothetical protein
LTNFITIQVFVDFMSALKQNRKSIAYVRAPVEQDHYALLGVQPTV